MRRCLCLLVAVMLLVPLFGCRQEPQKEFTADELTALPGGQLLSVLQENGLRLPDGYPAETAEQPASEYIPRYLRGEIDAYAAAAAIDYDGTAEVLFRLEGALRRMGLCPKVYTYDELEGMTNHARLMLFEANGLEINAQLRQTYTDEQLEALFGAEFAQWSAGKTTRKGAMYRDLAKQTERICRELTAAAA